MEKNEANVPSKRPRSISSRPQTKIPGEWRQRRDNIMSLSKTDYATRGKKIIRDLSSTLEKDENVTKVMYLLYEKAVKDVFNFPIAGLLFEDLGLQSNYDGEDQCLKMFGMLQDALQTGLSELKNKLMLLEKSDGVEVGLVFLLFSLWKLQKLRGSDGSIFRDLLVKLLPAFYAYTLAVSKDTDKRLNDAVVSALCLTVQVTKNQQSSENEGQIVESVATFLRTCCLDTSITAFGKTQVIYTLECMTSTCSKEKHAASLEYYAKLYAQECEKRQYLINAMEQVFCKLSPKTIKKSAILKPLPLKEKRLSPDLVKINGTNGLSQHSVMAHQKTENVFKSENVGKLPNATDQLSHQEDTERSLQKENLSPDLIDLTDEIEPAAEIQNPNEDVTEYLKVPEECVERIRGHEKAILRKLEFQSDAIIELGSEMAEERPETSSLTAHRLVAGSLGIAAKVPEDVLKHEREKIANAKEFAARYQLSSRQQEVKLKGTSQAVNAAKQLINEIVNSTTYLVVNLPGFTINEIVDTLGEKLRSIETLMNVIFRLVELDDSNIELHISGDEKSCKEAKSLILESIGSLDFSQGFLLRMPPVLSPILPSKEDISQFICKLMEVCEIHILLLQNDKRWFFFLNGVSQNVYKAQMLLNKVNAEVVFSSKSSVKKIPDLLELIDRINEEDFLSPRRLSRSSSETPEKTRIYSRESLLQYSDSTSSRVLPDALKKILNGDDNIFKAIILTRSRHGLGIEDPADP
eukprot:gene1069-15402_t